MNSIYSETYTMQYSDTEHHHHHLTYHLQPPLLAQHTQACLHGHHPHPAPPVRQGFGTSATHCAGTCAVRVGAHVGCVREYTCGMWGENEGLVCAGSEGLVCVDEGDMEESGVLGVGIGRNT